MMSGAERDPPRKAQRELGPGELPTDALDWLERELNEIDRLISKELNRLSDNNTC